MRRLILPISLAIAVASCSSGGDADVASLQGPEGTTSTTTAAQADPEQAVLEFAQCMRDSGVEGFPDPELDSNGNLQLFGPGSGGPGQLGADQDTLQAAFEECGPLVDGLIQNAFQDIDQSEFQDAFLEFAQCMRDNGIDMPDPDFSEGFGPGAGGGGGLFGDIDPGDPDFQAAAEACQGIFGANGRGGPFGGGGPGGPGDGGS